MNTYQNSPKEMKRH